MSLPYGPLNAAEERSFVMAYCEDEEPYTNDVLMTLHRCALTIRAKGELLTLADRLADAVEALLTECSGEDCYPCSHMNALEAALAAYRETTK